MRLSAGSTVAAVLTTAVLHFVPAAATAVPGPVQASGTGDAAIPVPQVVVPSPPEVKVPPVVPPPPEVKIPPLPVPAPTRAPVELPAVTQPKAAVTPTPAAAPSSPATPAAPTSGARPAPARGVDRPNGASRRSPVRRGPRVRRTRARAHQPRLAARAPVATAAPRAPRATRPVGVAKAGEAPPSFADDLVELIDALPAAVLWGLLGTTAVALGLAGNAFWQGRQRSRLEAQRAELLDDIGLLSSALLAPVPATIGGLAVSAAYRPADGPAAGGDFYDVFALDEQRTGVLLGDVSGHGRASVRQAALARYTLRTLLAAGHGPGDALAVADRLLVNELRPDFVTVILAVYDRTSNELTYAKAGHAPPIVLGAAHDPDAEPAACPIGLGLGRDWPELRLRLSHGASVCLYTDGLEDAQAEGTRLGRDTLVQLLAAQGEPNATQLLDDVRALAFRVADDNAAVVLSLDPATQPHDALPGPSRPAVAATASR